jgi:hypothetical protein
LKQEKRINRILFRRRQNEEKAQTFRPEISNFFAV